MTKGKSKRKRERVRKREQAKTSLVVLDGSDEPGARTEPESLDASEKYVASGKKGPMKPAVTSFRDWASQTSLTDRIVAFFTAALAVASIYQFTIMNGQLDSMRKDERAWVSVTATPKPEFAKDGSGNVTVFWNAVTTNTGKTPARHFSVELIVEKIKNGVYPTFPYGRTVTRSTSGLILPTGTVPIQAVMGEPMTVNGEQVPIPISASEYQEVMDGNAFIIIYGQSSYLDIFGKKHWQHFCSWSSPSAKLVQVTASTCVNYNDVDDN